MSANNECWDQQEYWDQVGGSYGLGWSSVSQQELSVQETNFVVGHVPAASGNRVLDVGVGNGRILESLLSLSNVSEVYGVDFAPSMLELCQLRFGSHAKLKQLSLCDVATESLPPPSGLQFLSAVRVLKYMPNWADVLRDKLAPQLAVGGVLVFSMPNRRSFKGLARPYAVHYEMTTESELRKQLGVAGFEVVEIAGFSRLPDLIHRHSAKAWSSKLLIATERVLRRRLSRASLATELFVAARRS